MASNNQNVCLASRQKGNRKASNHGSSEMFLFYLFGGYYNY